MATTSIALNTGTLLAYETWFGRESRHGDTLVYFKGDLNGERQKPLPAEGDAAQEDERVRLVVLDALADRVRVDAMNGDLALTQRRFGDFTYEYRATRLCPQRERLRQAGVQSDASL